MGLKPRARPVPNRAAVQGRSGSRAEPGRARPPSWAWNLADPSYPIIEIRGTDEGEITRALAHWWTKIAELAAGSEMWDTMVGDIWLDSGRIIGHVQMGDVAVGYDTGFRVAAHVDHIVNSLTRDQYDSATWDAMTRLLIHCAESAIELEPAGPALLGLRERHTYQIAITSHGQWLE